MPGPIAAIMFAAAAAAAPPAPSAPPPRQHPVVITNPDWLRKPTAEEVYAHYPPLMQAFNIEGFAAIRCVVTVAGDVEGCKVAFESPAGLGFGAGALELASSFKFRPKTEDGRPVGDGTVTIPIRFTLYEDPDPENAAAETTPAAAPDPQIKALCLRFAELLEADSFRPGKTHWAELAAARIPVKGDAEGRDKIIQAIEQANTVLLPKVYEHRAQICVGMFTRKQIEDTVRFLESPSGHAFTTNLHAMGPKMSKALKLERNDISALGLKNYCATSPAACPDPATRPRN